MVDYRDGSDSGQNATSEDLVHDWKDVTVKDVYSQDIKKKSDSAFLCFSALTANVLLFVCSNFHVWSSPVIPKLKSNSSEINPLGRPITTMETSMLAGLPFLIGLVGSIFIGAISDLIGRKRAMVYSAVFILLASSVIIFSNNIYAYIIARCGIFIAYSATLVLLPIYLTEICEDHNRAKYGCLMGISLPGGHLFSYAIGSITTIPIYTSICVAPILPFLVAFGIFAPETPAFLIAKGQTELAIKTLEKLRYNNTPQDIEREYEKIKESYNIRKNASKFTLIKFLTSKVTRKALVLALLPLLVQNFSGVTVIMQFMAPIFNEAGTVLSGNTISVIAGSIKVITFFTIAMFVEKVGRRRPLLISGYGTGVTIFFLGLFFYWRYTKWAHVNQVLWLPLLCLVLNLLLYSGGLGPIPMAIMSQLFTTNVRSIAISVIVTINGILIFLLNFLFPIISNKFGVHVCLWLFTFCCMVGTTLIHFFLPETKGRSILQIQELLGK
ncbi:facilitated trehalose transporter Tret1-2 homolog [Diorhabda carinulata]|uniref:facilitated trehalose transporter Tret1-2 homolog n=1 Tax=Diorhabda carinulata TaxID=1163345 RepID=UPI0025A183C5|nr:facilitated trehalose transporter Tret1-2 homolog [Diorhabda carinulata]